MEKHSNEEGRDELRELLNLFIEIQSGKTSALLSEEEIEQLMYYFEDQQNIKGALEVADLGIEQYPYSAQMMIKKADLLILDKQLWAALDLLDQAALYDSNDGMLYVLRADAWLALQQPEKAVEILQEVRANFEGDQLVDILFELSDVFDDYEEFDNLFDCLYAILQTDPVNEEALMKICFWADYTGRCEESIKLHQQIIDDYPYCELAWFNLGTAFQGLKLYEKAIDAYEYALAIDDTLDIAYRNIGDAYIRLRRFKEAIENLNKVLEFNKPEDVIYEALGHCYHKLGNYAKAREQYREASSLNPDDSRIYYKIAITYCKEEKWEAAVKQLETAMRLHKSQPDFNLLMGECKMKQGKLKEAIQYFMTVVRVRPRNVSGHEALIRCLGKNDDWMQALEQSLQAEAITGGVLFIYYQSGILFTLGKSKEALMQLERALKANPRLFSKLSDWVPGLLQRPAVLELLNKYLRQKKRR